MKPCPKHGDDGNLDQLTNICMCGWRPTRKKKRASKPVRGPYEKVAIELLVKSGVVALLEQALDALHSAAYVTAGTELEAHDLQKRAQTKEMTEYWRGRREAAWSIRRHCDKLEPAIKALYKYVPLPTTPLGHSRRSEVKKKIREAKALGRPK